MIQINFFELIISLITIWIGVPNNNDISIVIKILLSLFFILDSLNLIPSIGISIIYYNDDNDDNDDVM